MPIGVTRSNKTKKLDINKTVIPFKVFNAPEIKINYVESSNNFPDVYLTPQNILITGNKQAQSGFRLDSNGQAQKFNGIEWSTIENQWLNRGNASDYEVRVTYSKFESKGSYTFSGKIGTWIDLSSSREWISYASGDNSMISVSFNIEIRNITTKVNITTIPLTLTAHT